MRACRGLGIMQKVMETDMNINLGRLVLHYKDCMSQQPKSR